MDWNNIFKFEISLQKMSIIAVAASFWDRADVISKIENNFGSAFEESYYRQEISRDSISPSGRRVLDYIFEHLNSLKFPEKLKNQIKGLVIKMGEKICLWRRFVVNVLKINVKYANKIYWTACGEIDEQKIFQDHWMKDRDFQGIDCTCCMKNYLFCTACIYGQEDFVLNHLKEMTTYLFINLPDKYKTQELTPYGVISTWLCFCINKTPDEGLEFLKKLKRHPNDLQAKDFFLKCLTFGFDIGAKYFWDKLTFNEKQVFVAEKALKILKLDFGESCFSNDESVLKKEVAAKLLLFFMHEMTVTQRFIFISQNFMDLFNFFFKITWPYQELCEKLLDIVFEHVPDLHKKLLKKIIKRLNNLRKQDETIYFASKDFYVDLIHLMMGKISKELKEKIFLKRSDSETIENYYKNEDYVILKLIINDLDLKEHKKKILHVGKNYFCQSVQDGDYDSVDKFLGIMRFPAEELKSFKLGLNLLPSFLICGDFETAELHLNWIADSEEEKKKIINEIDAMEICLVLIRNNKIETTDKFLIWRYDNEEDRQNVKATLKTDEFIRDRIFEIWCCTNPTLNAEADVILSNMSSKLLSWFFDSEEEILHFKRNKLGIDDLESFLLKYWDTLYYTKYFNQLSDFLKFCALSDEEISSIKNKISSNVNYWIDTYALEKGKVEMICSLLDWVYACRNKERLKITRNYMNSPRGTMLCVQIFKNCADNQSERILDFFKHSVKDKAIIPAIKLQLSGMEEAGFKKTVISRIREFLDSGEREGYYEDRPDTNLFDGEDDLKGSDESSSSSDSNESDESDDSDGDEAKTEQDQDQGNESDHSRYSNNSYHSYESLD